MATWVAVGLPSEIFLQVRFKHSPLATNAVCPEFARLNKAPRGPHGNIQAFRQPLNRTGRLVRDLPSWQLECPPVHWQNKGQMLACRSESFSGDFRKVEISPEDLECRGLMCSWRNLFRNVFDLALKRVGDLPADVQISRAGGSAAVSLNRVVGRTPVGGYVGIGTPVFVLLSLLIQPI